MLYCPTFCCRAPTLLTGTISGVARVPSRFGVAVLWWLMVRPRPQQPARITLDWLVWSKTVIFLLNSQMHKRKSDHISWFDLTLQSSNQVVMATSTAPKSVTASASVCVFCASIISHVSLRWLWQRRDSWYPRATSCHGSKLSQITLSVGVISLLSATGDHRSWSYTNHTKCSQSSPRVTGCYRRVRLFLQFSSFFQSDISDMLTSCQEGWRMKTPKKKRRYQRW